RAITPVDDGLKHGVESLFELRSPPAMARAEEDSVGGVGDESNLHKRVIAPVDNGLKHDVDSPFELG
ncbi:hypothetical protein U1Q18_032244, partial [Sarracenia purpurea var. burkii]